MGDNTESDSQAKDTDKAGRSGDKKIDWSDPEVPVGNAPRMPKWTLVLSVVAWVGWVVFLLVMVVTRSAAPAV